MTTNNPYGKACRPFTEAFFSALVTAITEASGSPWLVAAVPDPEPPGDGSEPLRMTVTFAGELQGELLLELRSAYASLLAASIQQPAGELETDQSETLVKLVEAGVSKFCSAAAEQFGTFTGAVAISSAPASDSANAVELTAGDDGGNRISVLLYPNPALAEALLLLANQQAAAETSPAAGKQTQSIPEQLNLQLVLDVELNVTLRFGQRQLALREVLELTSGSVIELDRQVEEPVELLLEGKVIARGEAVVIDGNYGLRVTEVPRPLQVSVLR